MLSDCKSLVFERFNYLKVSYLLAYVNIFLYLYIIIIEQKILK